MTLEEILQEAALQKDALPNTLRDIFSKVIRLYEKMSAYNTKGSLYQKYVRCGTKGCHCAKLSDKGHGPYWYMKTSRKESYIGKQLPEEFIQHRFYAKELEDLLQDYSKIEITSNELRHLIKEFVLKAEPILTIYQEDDSN